MKNIMMLPTNCLLLSIPLMVSGCSPVIKVEAPDKPIVVNMNINIEHQLKVKIEKDLDKVIKQNPDIF